VFPSKDYRIPEVRNWCLLNPVLDSVMAQPTAKLIVNTQEHICEIESSPTDGRTREKKNDQRNL
jgi:hypothetical protein